MARLTIEKNTKGRTQCGAFRHNSIGFLVSLIAKSFSHEYYGHKKASLMPNAQIIDHRASPIKHQPTSERPR